MTTGGNCEKDGHLLPDEPDRTSMSEVYYDCRRTDCDYVDRRIK